MSRLVRRLLAWMAAGVLLGASSPALALDPTLDATQYLHTAWRVKDGFAIGRIFALAQTPDGYLWLGTTGGLYRFDGVRATPVRAPGLATGTIRALFVASDGRLWVGGPSGLASLKSGKVTQYPQLDGLYVLSIAENLSGTVWAGGSAPGGRSEICGFSRNGASRCQSVNTPAFGLQLATDRHGEVWAADLSRVWRLSKASLPAFQSKEPITGLSADPDAPDGMIVLTSGGMIRLGGGQPGPVVSKAPPSASGALLKDRGGGVWIGTTHNGLVHERAGRADAYGPADGLSGDYVYQFLEDREGDVWVATADGLDRFRDPAVATFTPRQGLSSLVVTSVLAARDGSLWFGNLAGVDRWKDGRLTFYRNPSARGGGARTPARAPLSEGAQPASFAFDPGLPRGAAGSLFEDSKGRVWVATSGGHVGYFQNGRFATPVDRSAAAMAQDFAESDAGILVSFEQRGIGRWDGVSFRPVPWSPPGERFAKPILADLRRGGLWFGSFQGAGIGFLKGGVVSRRLTPADGLGAGAIGQLQLDKDGTLWAATAGGLSRITDKSVATLSSRNGLPCDSVMWMMRDDARAYWLMTTCGLLRIPAAEITAWIADPARQVPARLFDASDGVRIQPDYPVGAFPRVTKAADGRIWFTQYDGLSVIDPERLAINPLPPPVHIEDVTGDQMTYAAAPGLRLPPLTRYLAIDFTALSLAAPEKVRFRYRLEGFDKDWREVVSVRQAQYTNLPPGQYQFRVVASNNSGVWNNVGDALDVSIAPAWWQTDWFQLLVALAVVALIGGLSWLRIERVRKDREAERRQHALRLELAHASRLATLGHLTASIIHEVSQPLSGIITNANTARRMLALDPPNAKAAQVTTQRILRDGTRAADVIAKLRGMFVRRDAATELLDLAEVAQEVIDLSAHDLRRREVAVETRFQAGLPPVAGDRVQIQQVILNLLLNGADAMSGVEDRPRLLVITTEQDAQGAVRLSVKDVGVGLEDADPKRFFEAFYTTKPGGMGIGLSVSRSIIEGLEGAMFANPNQDAGATFGFWLPAASAADAGRFAGARMSGASTR
jgi:signal transduction histidine kinase/ligand-binding sensor domain-containing protein